MKVKLGQIVGSIPVINKLSNYASGGRLDGLSSYYISKLARLCSPHVDEFNKQKQVLFEKYAEEKEKRGDSGEPLQEIPEEKYDEFNKELQEIAQDEITLDMNTINPDRLLKDEEVILDLNEIERIQWLLDE